MCVRAFGRSSDNRILMLGTPSAGSYSIPRLLLGRDALIRSLARWDLSHDVDELLAVFVRFPGILALLPRDDGSGFDFRQLQTVIEDLLGS